MKHLIIPDTQVGVNSPTDHLKALGNYIVDKQPEVIVQLGDFADMHSLSSYDRGTKAAEGARYDEDIEAAQKAMEVLLEPLRDFNRQRKKSKKLQYRPRMVLTLGNHENRINRHVNAFPVLDGKLSVDDLGYAKQGWEVHPFLGVIDIDGILYSHYFVRNATGRVTQSLRGATNAALQVRREMQSCTAGHLQGLDFSVYQTGKRRYYGLIAGSFYMDDYDYLTPQGTAYWRGVVMKNEVHDGEYDACFVSLDFLLKRYL